MVAGPDRGLEIALGANSIYIGSASECDLVLHDSTVSARHAEIRVRQGGYTLRDLGSKNGVLLGGWPIDMLQEEDVAADLDAWISYFQIPVSIVTPQPGQMSLYSLFVQNGGGMGYLGRPSYVIIDLSTMKIVEVVDAQTTLGEPYPTILPGRDDKWGFVLPSGAFYYDITAARVVGDAKLWASGMPSIAASCGDGKCAGLEQAANCMVDCMDLPSSTSAWPNTVVNTAGETIETYENELYKAVMAKRSTAQTCYKTVNGVLTPYTMPAIPDLPNMPAGTNLTMNSKLQVIARYHSLDQADFFFYGHEALNGWMPLDRVNHIGCNGKRRAIRTSG